MNRIAIPVVFLLSALLLKPAQAGNASKQDSISPVHRALASGEAWRPPTSIAEMVAPPSPEVAAMLRHSDEEISYAEGTASLAIPLYEWDCGDIRTSLSMRYSIRGYRMDERAGWTGLGWSFSGGGCVARTILGMPDEQHSVDIRSTLSINSNASGHQYFIDLEKHVKEAMLDRYSYSCAAGSGSFVIMDGCIIQTPRSDNTIEFCGDTRDGVRDFAIISPDGTRYVFSVREHIDFTYHPMVLAVPARDDSYRNAVSAWHLSSVTSPGGETVTYSYASVGTWSRSDGPSAGTYTILNRSQSFPSVEVFYDNGTTYTGNSTKAITTFHDQKILQRISSRTATLVFTHSPRKLSGGNDIPQMLSSVRVLTPGGRCVRDISFDITQSASVPSILKGITVKSEGVLLDKHTFAYNLPSGVWGCDIFGFANGPTTGHRAVIDINTGNVADAAKFSAGHAHARTLRSHSNALGLVTEYQYEPSDPVTFAPFGQSVPSCRIPVGVRIRRITDKDAVSGRMRIREFLYSSPECDIDFVNVNASAFISMSGEQSYMGLRPVAPQPDVSTTLSFLSRPRIPGFSPERATMRYAEVTELVSGTAVTVPIRTVRRYDLSRCRLRFVLTQLPRYGMNADRNIGEIMLPPQGVPEGVRLALGHGCNLPGGFEERLGAAPVLIEKTEYRHRNGEYHPIVSEKYFHSTIDSATIRTGFFHDAAVRDIINAYGVRKWDWQSTSDFTFSEISMTHLNTRLYSVAATRYFPDGSSRLASVKHLYSTTAPMLIPIRAIGKDISDLPIMSGIENVHNPFGSDSVSMSNGMRLHIGTRLCEGGRIMEHYTAYSSNMIPKVFWTMTAAGQKTLPVLEIWIADGRDTITKKTEYGRYGSCWRPTAITLTSPSGKTVDRLVVSGYTPYGKPAGVKRRGKPENVYSWGTIAGQEDLLMSLTVKGDNRSASLTTSFTHEELTGCTSVTAPDGSTISYGYGGGRLVSETNPDGKIIKEYGYDLQSSGVDGQNAISGRTLVNGTSASEGTFAETITRHDGFGMPRLELKKDFGQGGDVVTGAWSYDALHRTTRAWNPLPLSDVNEALDSEVPLENAAVTLYSDATAYREMVYPASHDNMPTESSLPGADFRQHPAHAEKLCSRSQAGEYRVIRYSCDGNTLRSSGVWSDGELDCIAETDGNGARKLTFSDAAGNTVLVRRVISSGIYADTYTVHDPWGNPLVVLPPEASRKLKSTESTWQLATNSIIADYAFIYTYDSAMRLRSMKTPGCAAVRYAYDSEGRLSFTQDGNLAASGRCSFILYDSFGRQAVTGTCSDIPRLWLSDMSDSTPPVTAALTDNIGKGFLGTGYSISCSTGEDVSISNATMLTASYYDNTGMQTGSLAAVLQAPGLSDNEGGSVMTRMSYAPGGIPVRSESVFPDGRQLISEIVPTVAGLPSLVTETLADGSGDGWSHSTSYAYDPFGRILSAKVTADGNAANTQASIVNGFDETGNVRSIAYNGNSLTRNITRDIRGAVSGWSMPEFGQQLTYGDNGAMADWCGRITSRTSELGEYRGRYDYYYNTLGFLTRAAFSSDTHRKMDFSASYDYDRQANLTYIKRSGMLPGDRFGTIVDKAVMRKGNRINKVYGDDAGDALIENQPQIIASGTGCTYDNNGNLTSDPSRGILDIEWSETGKPMRVSFVSGEEICYRYAATGEKLSEVFVDTDGRILRRRDIYGNYELTDGSLDRTQVGGGYLDSKGVFHVYVTDYQGNVIGIINAKTGTPVLFTDYYPYGIPHATAYSPEANRRKFGGKEYTSEFGFSSCDFGARLYSPLLCGFDPPDLKASTYTHISPYTYCAADPVNFIDPTGEVIIFVNGLDKFGAKPAGEEYWTQSYKRYNFVNGAKQFFNDNNVLFIPVKHSLSSSALERLQKGYDYAENNIIWLGDLKQDETIKFVTHSMGAAYAEGMATFLLKNGCPVTNIVHINAFQANDIKSLSKYNNVETTDYQYTDDWVINHIPIFSSPGFIDGANYIIREPSGCQIESFLNIHFDPISKGFNFWNKLRSKQNNCLLKPCKNNY